MRATTALVLTIGLAVSVSSVSAQESIPAVPAGLASSTPTSDKEAFRQPSADLPFSELIKFRQGKALFELDLVNFSRFSGYENGAGRANACSDCHLSGGRNAPRQEPDASAAPPFAVSVGHSQAYSCDLERPNKLPSTASQAPRDYGMLVWKKDPSGRIGQDGRTLIFPMLKVSPYPGSEAGCTTAITTTPPLIGLALLEAVPDASIKAWHDQHKLGRIPLVGKGTDELVGRFGYQSSERFVSGFVEVALKRELGLTEDHALREEQLAQLVFYAAELAVPKRQNIAASALQGYQLFGSIGCADCHRPSFEIQRTLKESSYPFTIWPFTDLLLHDLGYAESSGELWVRTTALWGIGRVEKALGFGAYLHDGRARTIDEAILWHGGEAQDSTHRYLALDESDRKALLSFLGSL